MIILVPIIRTEGAISTKNMFGSFNKKLNRVIVPNSRQAKNQQAIQVKNSFIRYSYYIRDGLEGQGFS